MATLTYVYADQTAVLGPLATFAEPHTYDLCGQHAERLTAPRGWEVVRLLNRFDDLPEAQDDLLAVAEALREQKVRDHSARRVAPAAGHGSQHGSQDDGADQGREGYPPGYSGRHRGGGSAPRAAAAPYDWSEEAPPGDRRARLRVLREPTARSADL